MATCRARFSAITLLLSISIHCTICATGGEATLAMVAAPGRAVAGPAGPCTVMPSRLSQLANACAASAAGVSERGRKLPGSLASCGWPSGVSRPWSTSSAVMAVTLPVLM